MRPAGRAGKHPHPHLRLDAASVAMQDCLGFSSGTWILTIALIICVGDGAALKCYNNADLFQSVSWTPRFSDDNKDVGTSEDNRNGPIRGYWCSGDWCDDKKLNQAKESVCAGTNEYWTEEFSDNYLRERQDCRANYYVRQIRCWDRYCDMMQLLCKQIDTDVCEFRGSTTSLFIEENHDYHFDAPLVLTGISCSGSSADYCSEQTVYLKELYEKEDCGWQKYKSTTPCRCVPCTTTRCGVGKYRSPCQDTGDGVCTGCTNKPNTPDGTEYTSSGDPYNLNNCEWKCPAGYKKVGGRCEACLPGSYQPTSGQTMCRECDVGTFQAMAAQPHCDACVAGKIQKSRGQPACTLCRAGEYQPDVGQTECLRCAAGKYQPYDGPPGSKACIPCPDDTYQLDSGGTRCSSCSTLTPPPEQPCRTCNSETAAHKTRVGYCYARTADSSDQQCFSSWQDVGHITSASTDQFGCSFCSTSSPKVLLYDVEPGPGHGEVCPFKRCFTKFGVAYSSRCQNGECLELAERQNKCKACHVCQVPAVGCVLRKYHCELDDGTCGCSIGGQCYGLDERKPNPSLPSTGFKDLCSVASYAFTSPDDPAAWCTGSWVNLPPSMVECVGSTACKMNQRCSNGVCDSDDYPQPAPCGRCTCTGSLPPDGAPGIYDPWDCDPYESSANVQCRPKDPSNVCDISESCQGLLSCPSDSHAIPHIGNRAQLSVTLLNHIHRDVGYISLESAFQMTGEPDVHCFYNGQLLPAGACPQQVNSDGKIVRCGALSVSYYLHIDDLQWSEYSATDSCANALENLSVLRRIDPASDTESTSAPDVGISSPSGYECIFLNPGPQRLPSIDMPELSSLNSFEIFHLPCRNALVGVADGTKVRAIVAFELDGDPQPPVCSEAYVVDNSPPPISWFEVQALRGANNMAYLKSSNSSTFSWDFLEWRDTDSDFSEARVVLYQCTPGQNSPAVVAEVRITSAGVVGKGTTTVMFPSQPDGIVLAAQLIMTNGVGLSSVSLPIEMLVDSSPPLLGSLSVSDCRDEALDDIDFQATRNALCARWNVSEISDPESGIRSLEVVVDKRVGSGYWREVAGPCKLPSNVSNVTIRNLLCSGASAASARDLEPGVEYRTCVSGVNQAGLMSLRACSDGVMVDSTPPEDADVFSINPTRRTHVCPEQVEDVQGSDTTVAIEWEAFFDGQGSRLYYLWEIGEVGEDQKFLPTLQPLQMLGVTAHNSAFINGSQDRPFVEGWGSWALACTNCMHPEWRPMKQLGALSKGFKLKHGMVIYAKLWCVNEAGLASSSLTSGITVDLTPPDGSRAFVNDVVGDRSRDGEYVAYPTKLFAYSTGFEDCQSVSRPGLRDATASSCDLGILTIQYAFGTEPGLDDVVPISSEICYRNGPAVTVFASHMVSLEGGRRYFATAIVCNRAGLCTNMSSDGVVADFSEPIGGRVVDGRFIWSDLNFVLKSANRFCAAWSNISDSESGIKRYEVALIQCHERSDDPLYGDRDFLNVGLNLSHCFSGSDVEVEVGVEMCAVLRITNHAEISVFKQSDGFLVCGPPSPGRVLVGSNPFSGLKFQTENRPLSFNWNGFRDAGAPFAHYSIRLLESGIMSKTMHLIYGPEQTASPQSWSKNLTLLHAHSYLAEVCVLDILDQTACSNSSVVTVDVTPPLAGIVTNGPIQHQQFQSNLAVIHAAWTGFSDPESNLAGFEWGLGSTSDIADIIVFQRVGLASEGSTTMELKHGDKFHILVRATNGVGFSATSASKKVVVHTQPPTITRFEITESGSSADRRGWNSSSKLELWWEVQPGTNSTVPDFPAPQIWVAFGTVAGKDDVLPRVNVNTNPPFPLPQLLDGGRLFVSLIAEDMLGRMDYRSQLLTIDATPPLEGTLTVDSEVGESHFTDTTAVLHLHWDDFYDGETGIDRYLVGMGTAPGIDDVVPFVNAGITQAFVMSGPFPPGNVHISVVAVNPAGLAASASVALVIDATPPVPAEIREVLLDNPTVDVDCVEVDGVRSIHAAWDAFEDEESGIAKYEVAVVCADEAAAAECAERQFHEAGLGLRWTVEMEMEEGRRYQVVVRAWNRAGLHSESLSDGALACVSSHFVERVSLSWHRTNMTVDCPVSRVLLAEIMVDYPTSQPIPDVNVAFGSCERCHDILPFRSLDILPNRNHSLSTEDWSCSGSDPVFVGSTAHLTTCKGSTPCQTIRFYVRWVISELQPCFLVVQAASCSNCKAFAAARVPHVDTTPPVPGIVSLQPKAHSIYYSAASSISVEWSHFHDPEGAIEKYLVGMGTLRGRDDVVPFVNAGITQAFVMSGPFPPGNAHISVVAVNPAGLAASASVALVIDATPPVPAEIREVLLDNPTVDVDCVEVDGVRSIHAAWDAFEDEESGIAKYEVAVVCADEAAAAECAERQFHEAGLGLRWTVEMEMEEGRRYQVVVRAWNRAGLHSESFSDGVRMLPVQDLIDVTIESGAPRIESASISVAGRIMLSLADTDPVLQSVEFGAGTSEGNLVLQSLRPIFAMTSSNASSTGRTPDHIAWSLLLPRDSTMHGQPVFVLFRTLSCTGKTMAWSHFTGIVDLTPPSADGVEITVVENDVSYGHIAVSLQWNGFQDPESGVISYSVGVGSRPGTDDVSNFTGHAVDKSISLHVRGGQGTYVTILAWNGAGLSTFKSVSVVHSPPVPSNLDVFTQNGQRLQTASVLASQTLRVSWDGFAIYSCSMKEYEFAVLCDSSISTTNSFFRSTGLCTSATITDDLVRNQLCNSSFQVLVRGWDECGLSSTATTASIQFISHDAAAPRIVSIVDGNQATEDLGFSGNLSVLSATAIIEGCSDVCTFRCGLGVLPFSFGIAGLSSEWTVGIERAAVDEAHAVVQCVFPFTLDEGGTYFSSLAIEYGEQEFMSSSNGVVIDSTPPLAGQVAVSIRDDFQSTFPVYVTSESTLNVSWSEFKEPESGPSSFTILVVASCEMDSLGQRLGSQAVLPGITDMVVPLKSEFKLSHSATPCICVEAVNKASLSAFSCVQLEVDDTAPTSGTVTDGLHGFDAECQLSDSTVMASWHGFDSKPSPIIYFEWAAGTCLFCTDIVERTKVSASTSSVHVELSHVLRINQVVWTSVWATNAAGLSAKAASNGVRIACSAGNCSLPEDTVCV